MIATDLNAPTQSTTGIVAASASPALSYEIGQHFKEKMQKARARISLPMRYWAQRVAAAGDNNALAGALSAGGAEAAAPYISKWLYGKEKGSDLTAEEKETVTAITNLLGTATGAVIGDTTANAAQGSLNAQSAVENNDTKGKIARKLSVAVSDETYDLVKNSIIPRNSALAGKLHPKTNVPFDAQGYPSFSEHLYIKNGKSVDVNIEQLIGNRKLDEKLANAAAGFDQTPESYIWHHHQDLGRMQLVKKDIHDKTGHTGGYSIYSKALGIATGIITSIQQANASDFIEFGVDILTPLALTSTSLADGTLDGEARRQGFKDWASYLEFQSRMQKLRNNSKFNR